MDGSVFMILVAACGVVLLGVLAWVIGRVDSWSQASAWRRIAVARRENRETARVVHDLPESPRCRHCPMNDLWRE